MNQEQPEFQETLKSIYRSEDKLAQLIEGLDEIPQQPFDEYYVKLQMIIRTDDSQPNQAYESIAGEKKDIELADLFENVSDSTRAPKKILILGGAGVGKSTLLQSVTYKWSLDELWTDKFTYVYRVSMKTILNSEWKSSPWSYEADELNNSMLKCLVHYSITLNLSFKEKKKIGTECIPWINEARRKREILLVVDGYDEVAHLRGKPDFETVFEEILEFENLVLTSRPNAINPEMRINFDRHIENIGLDDKGIEEYFERYFEDDNQKKKEELIRFLDTNTIIKEICKIPVNIAMLSYIWLYSESNEHLQEISSVTILYNQIINHLGYRYLQKKLQGTSKITLCRSWVSSSILGIILLRILAIIESFGVFGIKVINNSKKRSCLSTSSTSGTTLSIPFIIV